MSTEYWSLKFFLDCKFPDNMNFLLLSCQKACPKNHRFDSVFLILKPRLTEWELRPFDMSSAVNIMTFGKYGVNKLTREIPLMLTLPFITQRPNVEHLPRLLSSSCGSNFCNCLSSLKNNQVTSIFLFNGNFSARFSTGMF